MSSSTFPTSITWSDVAPALHQVGIAVLAGAVLAALGPFGSYLNGSPAALVGYWIGATLLGLLLYGTAYRLLGAALLPTSRWWWPALAGIALLASVPQALATRAGAYRLWPDLIYVPLPVWYMQTTLIGLVAMLGTGLVFRNLRRSKAREIAGVAPADTPTIALGGNVLALQMEDHYVRVHRPGGSELILLPLGRAIAQVENEGIRTHRSWWIARHAVCGVEGNARSMRLILSNGIVAPVARSAVTHLRASGWISNEGEN